MTGQQQPAQIPPRAGAILLSEPFLADDNFKRTVVLLCEHNEEGTFGFVINRPLEVMAAEAIQDFPAFQAPLFLGGPVENNTLHYLHRLGDKIPESRQVLDGLWWGGSYEVLRILMESGELSTDDIRLLVGYSGWSPGQLEEELKENSWIVVPGKAEYIFNADVENSWKEILKNMGGQYQIMSNFPDSPLLN